jgi:hypothetical protein
MTPRNFNQAVLVKAAPEWFGKAKLDELVKSTKTVIPAKAGIHK